MRLVSLTKRTQKLPPMIWKRSYPNMEKNFQLTTVRKAMNVFASSINVGRFLHPISSSWMFWPQKTAFLQEEIIKNILSNHTAYLSKPSLKKLFIDWIQKFSDKIESLTLTEKIHNLGYDVKEYYLKKSKKLFHHWIMRTNYHTLIMP